MNMAEDKNDVITQFQNISNRHKKKRILKKPNLTETSQLFENLGITCEREDLLQYAGLCYQAAAKCQNTLGNSCAEGYLLLKSSRQFMLAHLKLISQEMVATNELLHHSLTSYQECSNRFKVRQEVSTPSTKSILGGVTLGMGNTLQDQLGNVEMALIEYEKALNLFINSPVEKCYCYKKLISSRIHLGDYSEALRLVNDLIEESEKMPSSGRKKEILAESEKTRILLLLILQPTPQQIPASAAKVLERYAWVDHVANGEVPDLQITLIENGLSMLTDESFLLLQSLVMACQSLDLHTLISLQEDLVNHFNNEQKHLLRILMKDMVRKCK